MGRLATLKPRIQAASLSRVDVMGEVSTTPQTQPLQRRSRLYDLRRWRNGRLRHLREHPLCVACRGIAQVVDHEPPHKGNEAAFFDESTWVSLCKRCHDAKTAKHDGGFGNAVRTHGNK